MIFVACKDYWSSVARPLMIPGSRLGVERLLEASIRRAHSIPLFVISAEVRSGDGLRESAAASCAHSFDGCPVPGEAKQSFAIV